VSVITIPPGTTPYFSERFPLQVERIAVSESVRHRSSHQVEGGMMGSIGEHTTPRGAETIGRIVVALFEQRAEAEDAIRDLKNAGFSNEQIGAATQDTIAAGTGRRQLGSHEASTAEGDPEKVVDETPTGLAEGTAAGALTGGVIGGLVGLISSLLIPGVGPLILGGVLASTLLGMGVGAAAGGFIGALVGMGVPEEDARYFDAGLRQGRTLVTVSNTDNTAEALTILERHGGDLGPSRSRTSKRSESYQGEERRSRADTAYSGPERRLVGV
jgi:hypothetical protein